MQINNFISCVSSHVCRSACVYQMLHCYFSALCMCEFSQLPHWGGEWWHRQLNRGCGSHSLWLCLLYFSYDISFDYLSQIINSCALRVTYHAKYLQFCKVPTRGLYQCPLLIVSLFLFLKCQLIMCGDQKRCTTGKEKHHICMNQLTHNRRYKLCLQMVRNNFEDLQCQSRYSKVIIKQEEERYYNCIRLSLFALLIYINWNHLSCSFWLVLLPIKFNTSSSRQQFY